MYLHIHIQFLEGYEGNLLVVLENRARQNIYFLLYMFLYYFNV